MVLDKAGSFGRLILILFGLSPAMVSVPLTEYHPNNPIIERFDYVSKYGVKYTDKDLKCLSLNIYHEARSEPTIAQYAVGYTTINRRLHGRFGSDICSVVYSSRHGVCQFTWTCKPSRVAEPHSWEVSQFVARIVLDTYSPMDDPTYGALWYHNMSVYPKWARNMKVGIKYGDHVFYPEFAERKI